MYWTQAETIAEIETHVIKMGLLPMEWANGEGDLLIGRTHYLNKEQPGFVVLVRSARLPKGEPPSDTP